MERRSPFERVINFPAGLVAVTGILFALALLLVLSFRNNDGQILALSFTTDNYTSLVQDPLFARILLRSLIIAGLASPASCRVHGRRDCFEANPIGQATTAG